VEPATFHEDHDAHEHEHGEPGLLLHGLRLIGAVEHGENNARVSAV